MIKTIKKSKYIDYVDSETIIDNGHSIYITKDKNKKKYYLEISKINKVYTSSNLYELISIAIVSDDVYKDVDEKYKSFFYNERIYLYNKVKEMRMLKSVDGYEDIDYKIVNFLPSKEEIKLKKIDKYDYNVVDIKMKNYLNTIIQVKYNEETNEYINNDINSIYRNESDYVKDNYYWEKEWLKDLELVDLSDELDRSCVSIDNKKELRNIFILDDQSQTKNVLKEYDILELYMLNQLYIGRYVNIKKYFLENKLRNTNSDLYIDCYDKISFNNLIFDVNDILPIYSFIDFVVSSEKWTKPCKNISYYKIDYGDIRKVMNLFLKKETDIEVIKFVLKTFFKDNMNFDDKGVFSEKMFDSISYFIKKTENNHDLLNKIVELFIENEFLISDLFMKRSKKDFHNLIKELIIKYNIYMKNNSSLYMDFMKVISDCNYRTTIEMNNDFNFIFNRYFDNNNIDGNYKKIKWYFEILKNIKLKEKQQTYFQHIICQTIKNGLPYNIDLKMNHREYQEIENRNFYLYDSYTSPCDSIENIERYINKIEQLFKIIDESFNPFDISLKNKKF